MLTLRTEPRFRSDDSLRPVRRRERIVRLRPVIASGQPFHAWRP
jgi:hypothetical protein